MYYLSKVIKQTKLMEGRKETETTTTAEQRDCVCQACVGAGVHTDRNSINMGEPCMCVRSRPFICIEALTKNTTKQQRMCHEAKQKKAQQSVFRLPSPL